ncbi:MAG: DinB family protein [Limnohabitans sp.]
MNSQWASHFQTLARYNVWATERLLNAVAVMTEQDYRSDVGLFFQSVHGTLNHLVVGEHLLWFRRFSEGVSPKVALNAQVHEDRAAVAQALQEGASRWIAQIAVWPPERWNGVLSYTTMRGAPASLPFAATLAHVFNHATHHRGQITAALTHLGYECPELDMVYFLQEEQAKQA